MIIIIILLLLLFKKARNPSIWEFKVEDLESEASLAYIVSDQL